MVSGLGDKTYEEKLKELGMVMLEEQSTNWTCVRFTRSSEGITMWRGTNGLKWPLMVELLYKTGSRTDESSQTKDKSGDHNQLL